MFQTNIFAIIERIRVTCKGKINLNPTPKRINGKGKEKKQLGRVNTVIQ